MQEKEESSSFFAKKEPKKLLLTGGRGGTVPLTRRAEERSAFRQPSPLPSCTTYPPHAVTAESSPHPIHPPQQTKSFLRAPGGEPFFQKSATFFL
jgi:hypothetical protein